MKNLFLFLLIPVLFYSCIQEPGSVELTCEGEVISYLRYDNGLYCVNFDITNTGGRVILEVEIPVIVYFSNGFSELSTAYHRTLAVSPGETKKNMQALITSETLENSSSRYIKYDGEIVDFEFLTPEIICTN